MLKGSKIYLRALEPQDIDNLYQWENDCENWEISQTLVPFSRKILEDYIDSAQDILTNKQMRYIICLVDNDRAIGAVDLFDYDPINLRAGIGILIDKNYRKNGHALETLDIIAKYTSKYLHLHQLHCLIDSNNLKSIALFEKANFKNTGTQKDWLNIAGSWKDVLFYQSIIS